MARRLSPPFTLLAFQDIITSVTGIMVLVTLLLALELVHRVRSSPAEQTARLIKELEQHNKRLKAQIRHWQSTLEAQTRRAWDAQTVRRRTQELERQLRILQDQVTRSQRRQQEQQAQLRREEAELGSRLQRQQQQLAQLQKQLQELQRQLRRLQNRVVYRPEGRFPKRPWVVEISSQGFRIAPIGKRQPPLVFAELTQVLAWVDQQRDPGQDYFLLVVKPGGVDAYRRLFAALEQRGFSMGLDLLPRDKQAVDPPYGASGP